MKHRILVALLVLLAAAATAADSPFLKDFKRLYGSLDFDLLSSPVEVASVRDFVYTKDLATFTFIEGRIFLARNLLGRPNTAIFIGQGKCDIKVPSHTERMSLWYTCGDSSVHESFEVCFIRMADDLDLRLKEKFTFTSATLDWKEYNIATKQAQGEFFFRPILGHEHDNYFQLLRSCYERSADGYFWADFNRFTYSFDPNRPEEIRVGYEKYPNDLMTTDGVALHRTEAGISDDRGLSKLAYQTKTVGRKAELIMGGVDGNALDRAICDLQLLVLSDSLRFTFFYLNGTLKDDSLFFEGQPLDYFRRDVYPFVGVILPRYFHRGDTVTIRIAYHGRSYVQPLPFVENPAAAPVQVTFSAPKGNEYLVPGVTSPAEIQKGKLRLTAAPAEPFRWFYFKGHTGGYTPIPQTTPGGRTLTFLKSKDLNKTNYECFVNDDTYQPPVVAALDYFSARFGDIRGASAVTVFPLEGPSMPGLVCVPQVKCINPGSGGLYLNAGIEISRQWFGNLMQIASPRETWLVEAAPYYLGTMFLASQTPPLQEGVFFSELLGQRDVIYTAADQGKDQPLASGERVPVKLRVTKGSWVFHMLRYLMYDLEKNSDRTFLRFMNEFAHLADSTPISTASFEKLAEQYYGQPLAWFFDEWVYGRNIPRFDAKHTIEAQGDQWVVKGTVDTRDMLRNFTMPVICRVNFEDGTTTLVRQTVTAGQTKFTLGPFASKPKEFVFNEFFSVLGHE
jgi:hypothetical protein